MAEIICQGDMTDHGGTVISASSGEYTHGRKWAVLGDMVACPRCKGVFPISQGDSTLTSNGKPVAYQGCKTACGASLIAGQRSTTTEPDTARADTVTAAGNAAARFGDIGNGLAAGYEEQSLDEAGARFRGRFQLIDRITGEPVAEKRVRLRSTSGQYLEGATDADGFTQWVGREAAEALAFDLTDAGKTL